MNSYQPPRYCPRCRRQLIVGENYCRACGWSAYNPGNAPGTPPPYIDPAQARYRAFMSNDLFADCPEGKSRGVTALLALLFGTLGVHYFYVGKTSGGFIMLLLTVLSCGSVSSILALIQAIMLFCMTNQRFRESYILSNSTMPF